MTAYLYPIALLALSLAVATAEHFWPWRAEQKRIRKNLPSDIAHLVFNGHFLGVALYGVAARFVIPHLDSALAQFGLQDILYRNAASAWPVAIQIVVLLLVIDFIDWLIHNALHRIPFLWPFHQTHHSVGNGEMDFIVSFRFQWTEVVIYKTLKYFPLAFFGFGIEAVMVHAIFGTLIGHLNHSNLNLGHTWLRYIFNSPRMHLWHHDFDRKGADTVNFGIIFSMWDWIFKTAWMPNDTPRRIGFEGDDGFPQDFLSQSAWPISARINKRVVSMVLGAAILGGLWLAS